MEFVYRGRQMPQGNLRFDQQPVTTPYSSTLHHKRCIREHISQVLRRTANIDAGDADASTSKDRVNGLHSDLDPPKLASLAGRSLSTCDRTTSPMDPTTTDGMGCRERVEGWPSARRPTTHQLDVPDDDPDTYKGMYGRPLVALLPPFRSPVERRASSRRPPPMRHAMFPTSCRDKVRSRNAARSHSRDLRLFPRRRLEFEFAIRFRKRDDQVDGARAESDRAVP